MCMGAVYLYGHVGVLLCWSEKSVLIVIQSGGSVTRVAYVCARECLCVCVSDVSE